MNLFPHPLFPLMVTSGHQQDQIFVVQTEMIPVLGTLVMICALLLKDSPGRP